MSRKLLLITLFSGLLAGSLIGKPVTDTASFLRVCDTIWKYYDQQKFDKSTQLAEKLLKTTDWSDTMISPHLANIYNLLGIINKIQGNYSKALKYYNKAIASTQDTGLLATVYMNEANVSSREGDLNTALSYYYRALLYSKKSDNKDTEGMIYHNIGDLLLKAEQWNTSIKYTLNAITIYKQQKDKSLGDAYNNLAFAYQKLKEYTKSEKYYKLGIQYNKKVYGNDHFKVAFVYLGMADVLCDEGNYKSSFGYYRIAKPILLKTCGNKHLYTSYYYSGMGRLFQAQGHYAEALSYYQKALISKIMDFNNTSIYTNPGLSEFPDLDLLNLLKWKALAFEKLSGKQDRIKNLKAALATLKLCAGYIGKLRAGYLASSSKLLLASNEHDAYLSIVRISDQLFRLTKNNGYEDTAFEFAEQGRDAVLREVRNAAKVTDYAGVPDSVTKKESNIKYHISTLEARLEEENKNQHPDSAQLIRLHNELFGMIHQQENMRTMLATDYPAYYRLKYEDKVVSPSHLQALLTPNQALLEYVLSDSLLHLFVASKDTFALLTRHVDSNFYSDLDFCIKFLHSDHTMDYNRYCTSAYQLYHKLIEPATSLIRGKELILVPDASLALLSFDALLTEPYRKGSWADYRKLPYLIRKYPVGYSLSATLLCSSLRYLSAPNDHFAGFAPAYGPHEDSLPAVPGALESTKKISNLLYGQTIIGNKATKEEFEHQYKNYGILQFYLYGYEDTLDPSLSRMVFAPDHEHHNASLYAWEVSNMPVDAEMVVLVSGNSGSGPVSKGEGVLSMGRSFLDAGCSSTVLSLWSAYSKPSFDILETFYKQLLKGQDKIEALRRAKLHYLESTDPLYSNPRYWSGLVIVGNPGALFKARHKILLFVIGGMVVLVIAIMLFRKKL